VPETEKKRSFFTVNTGSYFFFLFLLALFIFDQTPLTRRAQKKEGKKEKDGKTTSSLPISIKRDPFLPPYAFFHLSHFHCLFPIPRDWEVPFIFR